MSHRHRYSGEPGTLRDARSGESRAAQASCRGRNIVQPRPSSAGSGFAGPAELITPLSMHVRSGVSPIAYIESAYFTVSRLLITVARLGSASVSTPLSKLASAPSSVTSAGSSNVRA